MEDLLQANAEAVYSTWSHVLLRTLGKFCWEQMKIYTFVGLRPPNDTGIIFSYVLISTIAWPVFREKAMTNVFPCPLLQRVFLSSSFILPFLDFIASWLVCFCTFAGSALPYQYSIVGNSPSGSLKKIAFRLFESALLWFVNLENFRWSFIGFEHVRGSGHVFCKKKKQEKEKRCFVCLLQWKNAVVLYLNVLYK